MTQAAWKPGERADTARILMEQQSQRLVTAFIITGLLFMLLPGTFLGVWNLLGISRQHAPGTISPAWLQAHGQAQLFGWIGSFILGIGFYSLTKMQSALTFPARAGWFAWSLWTVGVLFRWLGGVTGWEWRILLPLSGVMELIAYGLFYNSLSSMRENRPRPANLIRIAGTGNADSRTEPQPGEHRPMEPWMKMIVAGTVAFLVTMVVNAAILTYQALFRSSPALPHLLDQQFVILVVWGVLTPTIWGFNTRWLPIFAGFRKPNGVRLLVAYILSVAGILAVFFAWWTVSAVALFWAALLATDALHVWEPAVQPAKLLHVHASFPFFIRVAYVWLVVSTILSALAVAYDRSGGIWGASRHALTVGFIAGMVFTIGPRVLPAFCGMRVLWSTRLMFWSLLLLETGCTLRVILEPCAYESYWNFAWRLLPWSAILELTAVVLFAWNLLATLLQPPAHLRPQIRLSEP